ncbi:MAG: hypothetical protein MUF16_22305 [Burkholderiaceae bacterium]|nr:hypothetical protein [Burkholderiaceae bacterium]
MRILRHSAPLTLLCAAGLAAAEGGLKVDGAGGFWSDVQTKLRFSAVVLDDSPTVAGTAAGLAAQGTAPLGASLGGDYYFSKDLAAAGRPPSGFRASGALLIRQPGVSLSDLTWQSRATASLASPLRLPEPGNQSPSAMPYLGVGYSDYSLKTGWGFWADIGLVVQSPGNALGMGRVLSGTQSVDDLVRELRLSPMLQLGVNYSF